MEEDPTIVFRSFRPGMMKSLFIAAALIVALVCPGCVGPMSGVFPPASGEPAETIFVVNHGWHTGIVVPIDRLPAEVLPPWDAALKSKYLELGWGDDGYYRAEKVTSGMTVRALFGNNPSVLHIVAMNAPPDAAFPSSGVIRITLSADGFDRLCAFLAGSYALGEDGKPIDLGKGLYGKSRFYRATDYYYFPNTCNKWTARALRAAGTPITPFYAITAGNVFDQCRKFGTVVREPSDD